MKNFRLAFQQKRLVMILALTLALAAGGAASLASSHSPLLRSTGLALKISNASEVSSRNSFAPAVRAAQPSLVNIASAKVAKPALGFQEQMPADPLFRRFFGDEFGDRFNIPKERREQSLGSGVIVTSDGYILTNNHVIDGASDIRVTLMDKREFKAELVGGDAKTDIALLKVEATGLPAITLADSSTVQVGDYALALGNPFGVGQTVTMGIVSATGRGGLGIEAYEDFIQTDAAINPGNSGGALVNERGELIGVNTAIISPAGGNHGVGFAVPANLARHVMNELVAHGKVTRAYLGIVPQDVTPAISRAFGVKENRGALVGDLSADGPAAKAGVAKGDVILALDGKPVEDSNRLRMNISMMKPGANVTLKILRSGEERQIEVKLGELPSEAQKASNSQRIPNSPLNGIQVENLSEPARSQLSLPATATGVVVTRIDPDSKLAAAGLRRGDLILEVNRKQIQNVAEFEKAAAGSGEPAVLLINRHGTTLFVAV